VRLLSYFSCLVLVIFGVCFSLLNSHDVPINYFFGQKTIYFPLLFLILLFLGALIGVIAMLPIIVKLKMKVYQLKS
jgi:uncharacterized integral membrane protein